MLSLKHRKKTQANELESSAIYLFTPFCSDPKTANPTLPNIYQHRTPPSCFFPVDIAQCFNKTTLPRCHRHEGPAGPTGLLLLVHFRGLESVRPSPRPPHAATREGTGPKSPEPKRERMPRRKSWMWKFSSVEFGPMGGRNVHGRKHRRVTSDRVYGRMEGTLDGMGC